MSIATLIGGGDEYNVAVVFSAEHDVLPICICPFAESADPEVIMDSFDGQWISKEAAVEIAKTLAKYAGEDEVVIQSASVVPTGRNATYDLLAAAEAHGLTVELKYQTAASPALQVRIVDDIQIIEGRTGTLVVGYDEDREDTRAFRLDRISHVKVSA